MCGITGTVNWGTREILARMTHILSHRGPDDSGLCFFPEEKVGLGHRRLSIIDLSPAGHQPMSDKDGTLWIVYNGETYNFMDLRKDLEHQHHHFYSKTDTEVILRLYQEKGIECLRQLNGMFAFAILDRQKQKLFLVRDRLGIKPLYYYFNNQKLVFGSEIKAILASGLYSPDINWQGIYDYFTYLYVPCPQTAFKDIFQVPPAHFLELDLQTNEIWMQQYWKIGNGNLQSNLNYEEQKEVLRTLLKDSVRQQMISDVQLGIFLSGGVDSPVLTGLMAEVSSRPVKTFTIVFHGKDVEFYNEQNAARRIAQKFETEHREIDVDIGDLIKMLELVEFFDQPFGNPTFYLMHLISKCTRPEVTVALCGAGGDELFAGYPRYRAAVLARWFPQILSPLYGGVKWALGILSDNYRTMTLRRAREFFDGLDKDSVKQFVKWTYFFNEEQKKSLLCNGTEPSGRWDNSPLPSDRVLRQYFEESTFNDPGNRMLHVDLRSFLVDNLLEYTDKMSMAVGLEVRVPYLDHRVVDHSLTIPFCYKLRGAKSKIVLREVFGDLLPKINQKAPKRGFNVPLAVWMRDHLDQYFDNNMSRKVLENQGIFNWEYIQQLREQHRKGKRDNAYELFSIIMFDVWYHKYILRDRPLELTCH